jgi:hypothetical protein
MIVDGEPMMSFRPDLSGAEEVAMRPSRSIPEERRMEVRRGRPRLQQRARALACASFTTTG